MFSDRRFRYAALALLAFAPLCVAGSIKPIELPKPQTDGGKPLMQALKERKSSRSFGPGRLSPQQLSNLLWAAFGENRADGRRTAPSDSNQQEIEIYVTLQDGLYLFEPKGHHLRALLPDDLRALTGTQDYVKDAPVGLVYVADFGKMNQIRQQDKLIYSAAVTGFIGQNVYLYCASEGLANVVHASVDRAALAKAMRLRSNQHIVLVHTLGFPK